MGISCIVSEMKGDTDGNRELFVSTLTQPPPVENANIFALFFHNLARSLAFQVVKYTVSQKTRQLWQAVASTKLE